jgi:hypothetical protein
VLSSESRCEMIVACLSVSPSASGRHGCRELLRGTEALLEIGLESAGMPLQVPWRCRSPDEVMGAEGFERFVRRDATSSLSDAVDATAATAAAADTTAATVAATATTTAIAAADATAIAAAAATAAASREERETHARLPWIAPRVRSEYVLSPLVADALQLAAKQPHVQATAGAIVEFVRRHLGSDRLSRISVQVSGQYPHTLDATACVVDAAKRLAHAGGVVDVCLPGLLRGGRQMWQLADPECGSLWRSAHPDLADAMQSAVKALAQPAPLVKAMDARFQLWGLQMRFDPVHSLLRVEDGRGLWQIALRTRVVEARGASALPVTIDPATRESMVLMGVEHGVCSVLGGSMDSSDHSFVHTAARECFEESARLVAVESSEQAILKAREHCELEEMARSGTATADQARRLLWVDEALSGCFWVELPPMDREQRDELVREHQRALSMPWLPHTMKEFEVLFWLPLSELQVAASAGVASSGRDKVRITLPETAILRGGQALALRSFIVELMRERGWLGKL